jgi:hypothetical protein
MLLLSFVLGIPTAISAQKTEISEKDFGAAVYSAFATTRKAFPRLETETNEGSFRDGASTYLRSVRSEYIASDHFRSVKESTYNGKQTAEEMIVIGTSRYCRNDLAEWKTTGCYQNPPSALETAMES